MSAVLLFFKDILPGIVSLAAVIVSAYSVSRARKTQITSTYFTEMSKAYGDYLDSVSRFVFLRNDDARNNMVAALYRTLLFSSEEIASEAQDVYVTAIQWSRSGSDSALDVDKVVNRLGNLMRKRLASFDSRARQVPR